MALLSSAQIQVRPPFSPVIDPASGGSARRPQPVRPICPSRLQKRQYSLVIRARPSSLSVVCLRASARPDLARSAEAASSAPIRPAPKPCWPALRAARRQRAPAHLLVRHQREAASLLSVWPRPCCKAAEPAPWLQPAFIAPRSTEEPVPLSSAARPIARSAGVHRSASFRPRLAASGYLDRLLGSSCRNPSGSARSVAAEPIACPDLHRLLIIARRCPSTPAARRPSARSAARRRSRTHQINDDQIRPLPGLQRPLSICRS
ncbi:hypothetical protein ACLOJK_038958 [Asimina triloba]